MKRLFSILVLACTCLPASAMLQQGNRAVSQRMINHAATKMRFNQLWQKRMISRSIEEQESLNRAAGRIVFAPWGGHSSMILLWKRDNGGPYIHPESLIVGTVVAATIGGLPGLALYYAPIALARWYWLGCEQHAHMESHRRNDQNSVQKSELQKNINNGTATKQSTLREKHMESQRRDEVAALPLQVPVQLPIETLCQASAMFMSESNQNSVQKTPACSQCKYSCTVDKKGTLICEK